MTPRLATLLVACLLLALLPAAIMAQQDDGTIVITPLQDNGSGTITPLQDDGNGVLIVPPEDDGTLILPRIDGESLLEPDLDLSFVPGDQPIEDPAVATRQGRSAVLRGLDKLSGTVEDIELQPGETGPFGQLRVTVWECRYPEDNPSGDAFAYLEIRSPEETTPVFEGWMIASSPALNAIDHARYDLWVLRCTTS